VHTGGSIDNEHAGWARLFQDVVESLVQARNEHRAAQEATDRLSDPYQRRVAQEERTNYIHVRDAVIAACVSSARSWDALARGCSASAGSSAGQVE
jgi:hypothetical protein